MAKILYAWELGGSLGHLTRIYPILMALQQRGHNVSAAVRDQTHLETAWPHLKRPVYRAPYKSHPTAAEVHPVKYYVDILNNIGWGDKDELHHLLAGWQDIYRQVEPDFVIHDHCPTGLLVSQAMQIPHATLGTGFCSPPDESPTRLLRTWVQMNLQDEQKISIRVVNNVNQCPLLQGHQPLSRPTEPFSRATENFLTTFPELDHFEPRTGVQYWGIPNASEGTRPKWPEGSGPRVFAYLHSDARLPSVLQAIEKLKLPTLIYISGKGLDSVQALNRDFLTIVTQPVDLAWAAQQCAVGILNGSHGATAAFLLAGKPILQLPIQLEQYLGAKRSVEIGAALIVDRYQPELIVPALRRLLQELSFAVNANEFKDRYRKWLPATQTQLIVHRIEELTKKVA